MRFAGMSILLALLMPPSARPATYLGFDRNDYPGDDALTALRHSFAFTGYWLSNPPGEGANSWHGKRAALQRAGFGFLLLFNGRSYSELKSAATGPAGATKVGAADGAVAARAAAA